LEFSVAKWIFQLPFPPLDSSGFMPAKQTAFYCIVCTKIVAQTFVIYALRLIEKHFRTGIV